MTAATDSEVSAARSKGESRAPKRKRKVVDERKRQGKKMFLLLVPFIALIGLFSYFPLYGWIYAFFDYQPPLSLADSDFVGLQWFKMLVSNPEQMRQIGQVLLNTFAMSGLGIATSFLPVIFAICLNEIANHHFRSIVQTLTTLPNFISWVLVYALAFAMFSTTGMVNTVLQNLHIITQPISFLDSDSHTWLAMLLWSLWKTLGWSAIMYLAGIAGVDPELYEAAQVDGANRFQQIIHVTIPQILPTYFVMLMLQISNFLNNGMDQYYVFANAFNSTHIQVLDLYVYTVGMTNNSLSLATAISMLKSLVSVVLLFGVNHLSKRVRGVSII
ncbi:MAG: ABC transporter permease subunit [Bifidobacteriaceae bacterium]|jgi:multiple sugar transport system permease protein/putative aldouronate transport system permease protein|nr:ABC transporter permease subunit [Bifidobacteriaceae bacterium]